MVTVKVIGLNELSELAQQLGDVAPNVRDIAKDGSKYAKSIAPKDKGDLRNGIRYISADKSKAIIRSGLPGGANSVRQRPYHMWFHGFTFVKAPDGQGGYNLLSGIYSPKTGKPNYMFLTADKVSQDIDKQTKQKLDNLGK